MRRLRSFGAALAVVAAGWLLLRLLSGPGGAPPVVTDPPGPLAGVPEAVGGPKGLEPAEDAAPEIRGLRGTRPSGGLSVDADGHFEPGPEAVLFFEYWLSASNELSVAELTARIQAEIRARLDPPADAEAEAFLADYLDYLGAGDTEFRAPGLAESADLERRFQWIRELRREHFGPELAERLFGDDERAALLHLERRRIRDDPTLDPADRAARLEALESRYPDARREARARATQALRHSREERMLRAAGASPDEIDELREARFGREAADRMGELDRRRAEWAQRVGAYRAERDALVAEVDDPGERAAGLEALRAEHFSAEEARRIVVLDREAAAGGLSEPGAP